MKAGYSVELMVVLMVEKKADLMAGLMVESTVVKMVEKRVEK